MYEAIKKDIHMFKNKYTNLIFIILYLQNLLLLYAPNQGMVQATWGGRLGDQMLLYCRAKYYSLKYHNIPLYVRPFINSGLLALSKLETTYTPDIEKKFKHQVHVSSTYIKNNQDDTLFIIDWNVGEDIYHNESYNEIYKKMLAPLIPIPKLHAPANYVSVAVHIRKGSGGDNPLHSIQITDNNSSRLQNLQNLYSDRGFPLKFPPEQYYIDHINKLAELIQPHQLFVQIFSDAKDYLGLVNRIAQHCDKNIKFYMQKTKNSTLADLYLMSQFDCLIRPDSSFSMAAQIVGNHKIIIWPTKYTWLADRLIINEAFIKLVDKTLQTKVTYPINLTNQQNIMTAIHKIILS